MKLTRLDNRKLTAAVAAARKKLDEAEKLLAPFLVSLSEGERAVVPRTIDGFPAAARATVRVSSKHAAAAAAARFDPVAITEDLDNVEAITPIAEQAEKLSRLIADSKLVWLAEAWIPSLALYNIAKQTGKHDGSLAEPAQPLAALFGGRRRPVKKPKAGDGT